MFHFGFVLRTVCFFFIYVLCRFLFLYFFLLSFSYNHFHCIPIFVDIYLFLQSGGIRSLCFFTFLFSLLLKFWVVFSGFVFLTRYTNACKYDSNTCDYKLKIPMQQKFMYKFYFLLQKSMFEMLFLYDL